MFLYLQSKAFQNNNISSKKLIISVHTFFNQQMIKKVKNKIINYRWFNKKNSLNLLVNQKFNFTIAQSDTLSILVNIILIFMFIRYLCLCFNMKYLVPLVPLQYPGFPVSLLCLVSLCLLGLQGPQANLVHHFCQVYLYDGCEKLLCSIFIGNQLITCIAG